MGMITEEIRASIAAELGHEIELVELEDPDALGRWVAEELGQ